MAPSRGKGKDRVSASAAAHASSTSRQRRPRTTRKTQDAVPDVYQDMVDEAVSSPTNVDNDGRPLKKRKMVASVHAASTPNQSKVNGSLNHNAKTLVQPEATDTDGDDGVAVRPQQTVEASSDDQEDDLDFEEIDLYHAAGSRSKTDRDEDVIQDVSVIIEPNKTSKRSTTARRKPATAAEKTLRLQIHKTHLLCLLVHAFYVSSWCNNTTVHTRLRRLVSAKTISYLNPKASDSQFQRNRSFMDGLQQALDVFKSQYEVTASGMRSAQWLVHGENTQSEGDATAMDHSDFVHAAQLLEGSQDTGNQLFCALLRSVGVEARLVCSLQTLPLAPSAGVKTSTPHKFSKPTVYAMASDTDPASDVSADDASVKSSTSIGSVPPPRRRLGQPSLAVVPTPAPPPKKKKLVRKLTYPIWWVEAFNTAHQKWVPIDPVVTGTLNRPSKFEPSSSYALNQMSYVVAFEDDGVVRDVTRRYTKAYNAKTRRNRIDVTEGGTVWLRKALRLFRRRGTLDRDQVEDADLAKKEAQEGLPSNVQDFKDHPYYALERHLKRNEVVHPKREVGKANAGTAAKPRMESVFRRQDVLVCRSADKWYRLGREMKAGEQPLKHVPARRSRRERSEDDGEASTGLYSAYQTQLYVPPPVVNGKVPRNAYGNLDVYAPSMVPCGGTHIRHALAQRAARTLGIDFADAVTGFQFKGRHGTAIIQGVIVPSTAVDGVWAVIDGFEDAQQAEEDRGRSLEALRLWKRFMIGLRIKERVKGYGGGDDDDDDDDGIRQELDEAEDEQHTVAEAGGFFPDEGADFEALPTAGRFRVDGSEETTYTSRSKGLNVMPEQSDEDLADHVPETRSTKRTRRRKTVQSDESDDSVEDTATTPMPSRRTRAARTSRGTVPKQSETQEDQQLITGIENHTGELKDHLHPENHTGANYAGGFLPEEGERLEDAAGGFVTESSQDDGLAGGFIPDDTADYSQLDRQAGAVTQEGIDHNDIDSEQGLFYGDDADDEDNANGVDLATVDGNEPAAEDEDDVKSNAMSAPNSHADVHNVDGTAFGHNPHDTGHAIDGLRPSTRLSIGDPNLSAGVDAPGPVVGIADTNDSAGTSRLTGDTLALANAREPPAQDRADQDEADERGSLLSHDPEDEDAEPDWLESD